jgi:dTDP-4-dehydrorhamnose reductase
LHEHRTSERTNNRLPGELRVLLFGATGLLGKYLTKVWPSPAHVIGLSSRDADIRDLAQVRLAVSSYKPHWIVLAAAYTDVDGCEINPQLAIDVNCHGAINVARVAEEFQSRFLFISSDYVFDGDECTPYEVDDPVNPKSVYGKSKADAERGVAQILPESCIVRTSWLFGTGGKCFPDTILKLAAQRSELSVVDDQRGCPTYAHDLAKAIAGLCARNAKGVVHATNSGDCTWYEFAVELIRAARLKTRVLPTTTENFPRPAPRPKYSVLSSKSLEAYGISMQSWQHAVADYMRDRLSAITTPLSHA